jgi:hypothetical protein
MDIEERLAQNKKDIAALEVEKKKLEVGLERQKEPQHGDFGYYDLKFQGKRDPIVFLKVRDKIKAYNNSCQLGDTTWKVEIVGNIFKGDRI